MTSLGSKLRNQRERLGLTVLQVATQTKIREAYLQAIESDQLDAIPGGFFSRSFVRQYAKALGIKQDEIERELALITVPPQETLRVEKIYTDYRPTNGHRGELLPGEEEPAYVHEADFLRESRTGSRWIALAMLLIAASAGYLAWRQRPDLFADFLLRAKGADKIEWPPLPAPVAAKIDVPNLAALSETEAAAPVAIPVSTTAPRESAAPATSVEVAVVATEKSWVRLLADGNKLFGGTLEAGERRVVSGTSSAVVFTGNAGGLEVVYNGRPLGTVGPRGLVRTAVFTPQGYQIRASSTPIAGVPPTAVSAQP